MIGINVGVPAPIAWFPFTGWKKSFFGDLNMHYSIHFNVVIPVMRPTTDSLRTSW